MKFAKLTRAILHSLEWQGYTLLTSVNYADDDDPTWMPQKIADVKEYIMQLDIAGKRAPLQEPALLIINDALTGIAEEDLRGSVFLE